MSPLNWLPSKTDHVYDVDGNGPNSTPGSVHGLGDRPGVGVLYWRRQKVLGHILVRDRAQPSLDGRGADRCRIVDAGRWVGPAMLLRVGNADTGRPRVPQDAAGAPCEHVD